MAKSFSAEIDAWVLQTKERTEAVFKESTQRVIEVMQTPVAAGGNMPIDTGFLRASLQATLNQPSAGIQFRPEAGGGYTYDASTVSLVIAGADLGDTIYAVYGANYARHVNYGAENRPARQFVGLAAQRWPQIVAEVVTEAKSRVK